MKDKEELRQAIRKNYANVAKYSAKTGSCCGGNTKSSCCGSELPQDNLGCGCAGAPADIQKASINIGYAKNDLESVPEGSNMGLGCGNPIAIAALKEGETVLDLGSGGGFDCFLARRKVGGTGRVIGVDMTPDMIQLARKNAQKSGYANVEFRLGEIEHLPVADATVDVIISNCVINLSVDKEQVFRDAYRVLKKGGRLSVSDVMATAQLTDEMRENLNMVCGCIGGAEYVEDVQKMLLKAGFTDVKMTMKENSREIIQSWGFGNNTEDYVASYMIEAAK